MTYFNVIVLPFFLLCLSSGQQLRFGSFRSVPFIFNYTEGEEWCNPSFECDIISNICQKLGDDDCSLMVFDSLEERLTSLEENKVDIVVSKVRVFPEQEQRVDFVRPYYYSSGALLFTASEDKDSFDSYEELISKSVCMDVGYYVAQTLVDDFGLFIFPSTKESVAELINQDFCVAAIMDSIFILDGLVQTDLEHLYETPYAIAVSKSPKIPNLKNIVQKVVLEMMNKQTNENKSFLEQLEQQYFQSLGIPPNSKLKELSDAITVNDGEYIGAQNEDKIWQAANLTAVRKFSEDLMFIDPENDKFCRDSMTEIYDNYTKGTPLENLQMTFNDSLVYTFILSVQDPTKMFETLTMPHHPFFEPGTTGQEVQIDNPQFITAMQAIQQSFLKDEKNKNQGEFFYSAQPFDAAPVINDPNITANAPTRVIKTVLFQTLQEQNEENEQLLLLSCGVGELRDW